MPFLSFKLYRSFRINNQIPFDTFYDVVKLNVHMGARLLVRQNNLFE